VAESRMTGFKLGGVFFTPPFLFGKELAFWILGKGRPGQR
jgi:hypothetical protein